MIEAVESGQIFDVNNSNKQLMGEKQEKEKEVGEASVRRRS
jgi:hypothetical protein